MNKKCGKINALKPNISLLLFAFLLLPCLTFAQALAPGAPGKDAQWATAGKQAVGTSASLESKVWFTLAQGVMTEVYYPDVTTANFHNLQFLVVDPKTKKVETEKDDANHHLLVNGKFPDSASKSLPSFLRSYLQEKWSELDFSKSNTETNALYFSQWNSAKNGKWFIFKSYVTDPKNNTVLMRVYFFANDKDLHFYVYSDPSMANSGMRDTAWNEGESLLAQDGDKSAALIASKPLTEISNGFYGASDGLEQLKANGKIITPYAKAENGNAAQIARVNFEKFKSVDFALGFGKTPDEALKTARNSLIKGFDKTLAEYTRGWSDYIKTIPKVPAEYQAQFNMAAMQLKAHEDKTVRGANIASLSIPWGGGDNANENSVAGYHLIWSRDLYQVFTAYMALGDRAAAERALDFLFKIQQKPDGSFPQNSFLDGRPFWGSLQMDEVAYPLIMAYELKRFDKTTWENHVKLAADFIVKNGPRTPQERWEEEAGFSPSTIATEIAGLVCAAEIARQNGDEASATIYLATADDWARNVDRWTATTTGKYGDGNYYLRITQNGNPDQGEKIELNNGAGFFDEREIIDAGFLELVRLGIKSPDDPLIRKSVKIVDQIVRVETPNGTGFYRYNHDGYGEMDDGRRWNWDGKYTGKGRLWALLSGERGQYEVASYDFYKRKIDDFYRNNQTRLTDIDRDFLNKSKLKAVSRLDSMLAFANDGLMIPEQIWDKNETPKNADKQFVPELKFGEGTGSATPLAWSMAQFIRLAVNLKAGKNLDTPEIVYNRYIKNGIPRQASNIGGTDQKVVLPVNAKEKFSFTRRAVPNAKVAISFNGEKRMLPVNEKGDFAIEIVAPEKEEIGLVAVILPNGASAFERIKVNSLNNLEAQTFSAETIERIKKSTVSPIIENGKTILFYRGAAKDVQAAGDMTDWNPGRVFLQKVGADLFAVALDFPATARVEYKLIVDGKWIFDPLNAGKLDNGVGSENSFFVMPEYRGTVWDKGATATLENTNVESKVFKDNRVLQVYVPVECQKNACSTLYFQDGNDYFKRANAVQIQQNLVKAGKVEPFIMVFIDPKDRVKEYWANDDYARFLATEVVPVIDAKYKTVKNRDARAILGASLGGVTSVWVGLKYPETFARLGGQSSSFWIDDERVVQELSKLDAAKTKFTFYFDDGILEGVEDSRRVNALLRGKGFPVAYAEGATGHNWTSWRDRLGEAFVNLWKK